MNKDQLNFVSGYNDMSGSETDQLASICLRQDELIRKMKPFVTLISVTECNGYKCRENNCASCFDRTQAVEFVEEHNEVVTELLKQL